jgi:hypothetical protein
MPPPPIDAVRLSLLRRWAVLLDSAFVIPGIQVRFGLDPLLGLVPGIGDFTTPAFTVLLLATGLRLGVPLVVLTRMVMNAAIDALVGIVPLAGDLLDVGWKANLRNMELLERHAQPGRPATRGDIGFVAGGIALILVVIALAVFPIVFAFYLLSHLCC